MLAKLAAGAATIALSLTPPAFAEPQPGHLGKGDPRLKEGQYYDDYPVETAAGQKIKFTILARDFTPYAMLYSPSGELAEHTHGSFSDGGYGLATAWETRAGGVWHLIVSSSYPDELDYTIEIEVLP